MIHPICVFTLCLKAGAFFQLITKLQKFCSRKVVGMIVIFFHCGNATRNEVSAKFCRISENFRGGCEGDTSLSKMTVQPFGALFSSSLVIAWLVANPLPARIPRAALARALDFPYSPSLSSVCQTGYVACGVGGS